MKNKLKKEKKLFFLVYSLSSGGAERISVTLANHFANHGYLVNFATISDSDSDFYSLNSKIYRIELGLNTNSFNFISGILNNIKRVFAVRKLIKNIKPDVAIAMMSTPNILLSLASLGLSVRTIGSERIHPPMLSLGIFWELLRRITYPNLDYMVAQTQTSAEWLGVHAPSKNIFVIPNPVNYPLPIKSPQIEPNQYLSNMDCKKVLLSVGRLDYQKGFDRLIDIFSSLSIDYPDWGLIILGEGNLRASLESQIKTMGLEGKIKLPGTVGNVYEWYMIADIYALSSRFEGFPNTLIEAMSYGVPSIAFDCETGPSDIIDNEINGILIENNNLDMFSLKLQYLMNSIEARKQIGMNAISVRNNLHLLKIIKMWENLF